VLWSDDDHDDVLWERNQQRSGEQRTAIAVEQQRVFARTDS
jgi:hypothetical protein